MADLRTLLPVLACSPVACAHQGVPDRSLPMGAPYEDGEELPSLEEVPVRGVPTEVTLHGCTGQGELLAADDEAIWLQVEGVTDLTHIEVVRWKDVQEVSIELHESDAGWVAGWTAAGVVSTASHGLFLVLTVPVWLIVGISAGSAEAAGNDAVAKNSEQYFQLFQFARFPQGMPPALRARARRVTCTR